MKKFNAIVLLTVLFISQMPVQRAKAQAAAVAVPVGAAVVVLGGIAYYVWYNSRGEEQMVPMLDNPDARTESWEDDEFADSQAEAESRCRQKAELITQDGNGVVRSRGARHVSGKLYKCQFESEV